MALMRNDPSKFLPRLPDKKPGESDTCIICGHPFEHHSVHPDGKCADCHDPNKGFMCDVFNKGKVK